MDSLRSNDLNRMLLSIENDVNIRLKEINQETAELYAQLKSEYVSAGKEKIEKQVRIQIQEIKKTHVKDKSAIYQRYRMDLQRIKHEKVMETMARVKEELKNRSLENTKLLKSCVKLIDQDDLSNYYLYCNSTDNGMFKKSMFLGIKPLPASGLGGLILVSSDGRKVFDNCFASRMEKYFKTSLDEVVAKIFHKKKFLLV
ncbi:hypothetical protein ENBRE01_1718 [Enteropsectra breve]|nr:hypothetical protein ENBRE01_1718 [Enteropsectra breve]